ncbi:DUF2062 domain-containing protein [Nitratireductor sp. CAU 1489]|uniref:DUF2062 domain-containing protein n=1 Tax=Nitratireductor arenosus TaxID=2682096 RepID=A0A844QNP6_9HYPH|nr:DUF2062 domain-containing protein [Nitratireductor arenosus]MVA99678.1 DUF2062 domain-containing protein [Nitratireductor arenosus]
MLFRRRKPADMWERTRTFVWPRRSFWRSAQYYAKRVLRLNATPHAIAAGIASGVFVSFMPFLGFHFIFAAVFAWVLAGNLLASAIGTAIGNPITFPLIWASTYELGSFLLGTGRPGASETIHFGRMLRHLEFSQLWDPLLKPMTAGGIPLGMAFALGFYLLTRWGVAAFRRQRQRRLAERAMRRALRPAGGAVARG